VRLVPDVTTRTIEVETCGYGCGVPSPPPPISIADLGVERVDQIEIVEEKVRFERVVEHCEHPVPVP
ncbi:MAG TPA: hypothetical protein VL400_09545, partial [Polyangiaceae bacterium]|nr:hypothetical protein [Polyangiaceae bacterium]